MEEVSAFAIYKKSGISKKTKKNTPKKQKKDKINKKSTEVPSEVPLGTTVNGAQNVVGQETASNGVDKVKVSRKRKQMDKKEAAKISKPSITSENREMIVIPVDTTEFVSDSSKTNTKKIKVFTPKKTAPQVKVELPSPSVNLPIRNSSIRDGTKIFKWLLSPIEVDKFFEKFWEKAPCLIERNNPTYFSKLISFEAIDQMLIDNHIEFTKNIDITSYKNGVRETLNPEGRAMPPVVWDQYSNGCSIRLLNPQTYMPSIFSMNATLQELFHCMVGSNAYLTPPNSQGFAPHYDDIEAFVLQIEGRKRWKLYNPRSKKEELPRFSSENFSQKEIGKPILEKVLMPGDILYFPRGVIHQAFTEPGYHSLHITLSVYQKQSYADLMEKMFPLILQRAIADNVEFRRGLPLNVWHNAGIVYSDVDTRERQDFLRKCRDLISKALKEIPVDQAIDQLAKKYQHEALPPDITPEEKARTVFGSRNVVNSGGQCVADYEIGPMTKVRLLRANIIRLIEEEDKIRIYYYVDNSKEYCEYEPNYIEMEPEDASSVEVLIKSYPEYVAVNELPLEDDEEKKISIVQALWERGLLMFDRPFSS